MYNDSYHVTIKDTPNNKINEPIKDASFASMASDIDDKPKNAPMYRLNIGDSVRVYVRDDNKPFNKLTPLWSKDIYRIQSYDKAHGYYTVNNKLYRFSELQQVNIKTLMRYKY